METMERGTIGEMALEARKHGCSYGQWVAARYYPVEIVEKLPDGGKIRKAAALPPVVPGWQRIADRYRSRSVDGPVRTNKPKEKPTRKCVVCGEQLRGNYRKYCSEECRKEAAKGRTIQSTACLPALRFDKKCTVCGKMMHQVLRQAKYCGPECRKIGTAKVMREYRAANPVEKHPRYCQICGIRIEGNGHKYCTNCAGAEIKRRHQERDRLRRKGL